MRGPKTVLSLQQSTNTTDDYGSIARTWSTVRTMRGVLTPSNGRETVVHDKITVRGTHVFYVDCKPTITFDETYRFMLGSRVFDIVFIEQPGNMGRHYEITLEELA